MKFSLTFMDFLSLQLLTLKVFDVINCSWWVVFLPIIIKWGTIIGILLYAKYVIIKTTTNLNLEIKDIKDKLF